MDTIYLTLFLPFYLISFSYYLKKKKFGLVELQKVFSQKKRERHTGDLLRNSVCINIVCVHFIAKVPEFMEFFFQC